MIFHWPSLAYHQPSQHHGIMANGNHGISHHRAPPWLHVLSSRHVLRNSSNFTKKGGSYPKTGIEMDWSHQVLGSLTKLTKLKSQKTNANSVDDPREPRLTSCTFASIRLKFFSVAIALLSLGAFILFPLDLSLVGPQHYITLLCEKCGFNLTLLSTIHF